MFLVQKFKTGGDNFIPLIARWPGKRLEKLANYLLTVFAHWCLTILVNRCFHCYFALVLYCWTYFTEHIARFISAISSPIVHAFTERINVA